MRNFVWISFETELTTDVEFCSLDVCTVKAIFIDQNGMTFIFSRLTFIVARRTSSVLFQLF